MKNSIKKIAITTLFSALSASAFAAPVTYTVDETHTFPRFSYSHFGLSLQMSSFTKTSGKIVLDTEANTGSADITIDMKTVNTGSSVFNKHIQAEDFFDTEQFPTATFKSTKVIFEGDKPKRIDGLLTLKGITKPVSLTLTSFVTMAHPMVKKPAIGANAFTTVKRSEFNAGKYAPNVGDEVRIDIAVEAIAQ